MSREILFRGKTDKNDNWVYGSLNNTDPQFPEIMYCDRNWNIHSHSIKPETIGQFTGLTDKNGTKIFEGDILNLPPYLFDGERCVCVYQGNDTGMGFELMEIRKYCLNGYGCILSDEWEDFEIVGNIWDNPELLKED